jgi:hypothetical protein
MSQNAEEVQRSQLLIRTLKLTMVGTGRCPGCQRWAEIFSRQQAIPGVGKERCLDCWKAEC